MNPFSGFLQPPQQRSPLAGAGEFVNDLARLQMAKQAQAQDVVQQKDSSARDWKRIGLQEAAQNRNFSDADKKEVESLLAEYQDAEDQGDHVRLDRAGQMLKRFGMDVSQGQQKPKALPGSLLPDVTALTGSREPTDLSQADFEEQLTNGSQASASSSESAEPDIAGHLKSVGPLKPLKLNEPGALPDVAPTDMGDVDSPEFKAAAQAEGQPQQQAPAPLPGSSLPTVISKGGKTLYESTGPSGRWSPMVKGVFEPYANHENEQIANAAKSAQGFAEKLIQVDGMSPAKAIETARDQMMKDAGLQIGLERTKLGTRPKWGGGGGAAPGVNAKGRLPLSREMTATIRLYKNEGIESGLRGYESALAALNSDNPASQNDALNQLIAARSGKTVSDRERALYNRAAGIWEQAKKAVNMAAGEPMPEGFRNQLRQVMNEARQVLIDDRENRAQTAAKLHAAKMRGAMTPEEIAQDSAAVADAVRFGATPAEEDYSDL